MALRIAIAQVALTHVARSYFVALPDPTAFAADEPDFNGWTPLPTQAPFAEEGGLIDRFELFGRQIAAQTCGYVNGNGSRPVTCAVGYGCGYDTSYNYGPVCCPTNSAGSFTTYCPPATACIDYANPANTYYVATLFSSELWW
ncbi:hypothetical protein BAUCODRAFT_511703 [Baudoinia panamericana UAMH 10762]|uniref:Uncharacterized protein n=1 Tax=Baudoinia panamericana (strain UAMH 10762) TaxID=717646 RepID=M2NA18_BAUPA|nr:uncharacterized protein BAUCODRAFT_511703 [Baudoinia panamericana UAMH 10762]EMC95979.1 hypothetical protein BAUCODRAFT_511703 [Baudoinia panamericana UAMH 10762]